MAAQIAMYDLELSLALIWCDLVLEVVHLLSQLFAQTRALGLHEVLRIFACRSRRLISFQQ